MGSPFVSPIARGDRHTINAIMRHHGFVEYPHEFCTTTAAMRIAVAQ